jgi:hypothetical protein
MRANLEKIRDGKKPGTIKVGVLTAEQLAAVNVIRNGQHLQPISAELHFVGRHIYESRIDEDKYTIEDVLDQIHSGMASTSEVFKDGWAICLRNNASRSDRYGKQVNDVIVMDCIKSQPKPELYGVIPKGDGRGPKTKKGPSQVRAVLSSKP